MGVEELGQSRAARAFGAKVEVARTGRGLYLVVGKQALPQEAVALAGGEVILRIGDRRLLAVLTFEGHLVVKRRPEVALIGPVTVDPVKFARFAGMIGLETEPAEPVEQPPRQ